MINGKLQLNSQEVRNFANPPFLVKKNFTDSVDSIAYDITSAYNSPVLKRLTRQLVNDRSFPSISIIDDVEFNSPSTFVDSIITKNVWTQVNETFGYIFDDTSPDNKLYVSVLSDAPFIFGSPETLFDSSETFTRVNITLLNPISKARVIKVYMSNTDYQRNAADSSFETAFVCVIVGVIRFII